MRTLRNDKDRVVVTADKRNCTVVLHRKSYNEKVLSLLEDDKTYMVQPHDPTTKIERVHGCGTVQFSQISTISQKS